MSKVLIAVLSIVCILGVAGAEELVGQSGLPYLGPELRPEMLYQGDLIPETGLGCATTGGPPFVSGGPNDIAVGVIATLAPPFCITSHIYNIYTSAQTAAFTALSFVVYTGMVSPGTEIGRQPGMDWTLGTHTVAISPPLPVPTAFFFFGQAQPQSNTGIRWGLDTSSPSAGVSYIKAPSCGLASWGTLESIGYPGNWCIAVSTDAGSPVELQSWGSIKAEFN
jgi:hypothetical protein